LGGAELEPQCGGTVALCRWWRAAKRCRAASRIARTTSSGTCAVASLFSHLAHSHMRA
jgi:hypothetical protein